MLLIHAKVYNDKGDKQLQLFMYLFKLTESKIHVLHKMIRQHVYIHYLHNNVTQQSQFVKTYIYIPAGIRETKLATFW